MALLAALLGWMFDGFEIGLFPLVGPNALKELLQDEIAVNPSARDQWFGVIMAMFLIGAATGGVVFGWLGDRVGRVRAMSLSILTYAIFTGLCGLATEAWHIAACRPRALSCAGPSSPLKARSAIHSECSKMPPNSCEKSS